MASLYNSQRVLGVRLQAEGATMHNFQRTIGIVPVADAVTFSGNDQTLGVAMLGADQAIYNDQPVIGGVLISDGRTMYNDQPVVPVSVRSGAMFDFLAGSATGGSQIFTRSSSKNVFDATGVLTPIADDAIAIDYEPTTLAKLGALLEPARTNSLRNNTGVGAGVGVPGTLPTNWTNTTPSGGIARSIIAADNEDGIASVTLRYVGTASGTAYVFTGFESSTQIVAAAADTWAASAYVRVVGGSMAGATLHLACSGRTAAGADVDTLEVAIVPTTAALKTQRTTTPNLLSGGTIARVLSYLRLTVLNGVSVDMTLKIGLPQLELGSAASSPIATSTVAASRAADVLTLTPADAGALTWRVRYDDNSEATLATGVTGDYVVDPATLARPRVKAIWATP